MIWFLCVGLLFGAFLVAVARAVSAQPVDVIILAVFTTYPFFMAAHIITEAAA